MAAIEMFKEGSDNIFDWIYKVWQTTHNGDECIGKALLLSTACQCIRNVKGIHIALIGSRGSGKSDAAKKMINLLPKDYRFDGSLSPKHLYGSEMKLGTTILVDDMVWNDELGITVKRVSTDFQSGSGRGTKDDMKSKFEKTPERLTFWVTSVDSQADEQLRDRFLLKELNDSPARIAEIKDYMKRSAKGDEETQLSKEHIEMCQDLICEMRKAAGDGWEVVIPFADRIDIVGDTRPLRIFLDMVMGFAAFNYKSREKDDKGRLIATVEDYYLASQIYEDFGGHSADKYSEAEKKVLKAIIDSGYKATTSQILKKAEISGGRLSQIMYGKGDKEKFGLLYKCKGLDVRGQVGGTKTYILPENFEIEKGNNAVTLRTG